MNVSHVQETKSTAKMSFGNPKVSLEIKPKIIGTEGIPFTRKLELFASSQARSLSERSLLKELYWSPRQTIAFQTAEN